MEKAHKSVAECDFLHHFHCELVVVGSDICRIIDRSKFVLCRGYFVVLCLCKDTELPEFTVEVCHIFSDSRLDRTEIVIVHFLSLWRHSTEKSSACHDEVFTLFPHLTVYEEIFLLRAD